MFLVREVLHCKPGKSGEMAKRFNGLTKIMKKMGMNGFRIMTDISGEQFWTVVAELEVDSLNAMGEIEGKVMSDEGAKKLMAGYHDLIIEGRREIYKLES